MAKSAATKSYVQKKLFQEAELRKYSESQREFIARKAVERIRQRSNAGLDANGRPFRYAPDSEFVGNNLTLTGDMLTELDVVNTQNGITIGYTNLGTQEALQAEGHQEAIQSGGRWKKEFIGLTRNEKDLILAQAETMAPETQVQEDFLNAFIERMLAGQGDLDG